MFRKSQGFHYKRKWAAGFSAEGNDQFLLNGKGNVSLAWSGGPKKLEAKLKKQIEEAVASGKLAHLVKDIHRNNQRNGSQGRNNVKVINMIRGGGSLKRPFEGERFGLTNELTFLVILRHQLTDEPIILEGMIEGIITMEKSGKELCGNVDRWGQGLQVHGRRIKKLSGDTSKDDGKGLDKSKRAKRGSIPGRNSGEKQKRIELSSRRRRNTQKVKKRRSKSRSRKSADNHPESHLKKSKPNTKFIPELKTIGKFIPKLVELKYPINKGVGIILASPDEKMHSYAIRLKFNASDHGMDYEALLAGLVASINKGDEGLRSEGTELIQIFIKAKLRQEYFAYADSDKEAPAKSLARGFSDRFSLESSGTSDTHRQTRSTSKSQRTPSKNKEPAHLRRSRRLEDRSITKEKTRMKRSKSRGKKFGYQETSSDSEYEEGSEDTYEDLNSPYKRPKPTPFT
ncbi:hypothetical protein Tco_0461923 [Tanacetum coccineum]